MNHFSALTQSLLLAAWLPLAAHVQAQSPTPQATNTPPAWTQGDWVPAYQSTDAEHIPKDHAGTLILEGQKITWSPCSRETKVQFLQPENPSDKAILVQLDPSCLFNNQGSLPAADREGKGKIYTIGLLRLQPVTKKKCSINISMYEDTGAYANKITAFSDTYEKPGCDVLADAERRAVFDRMAQAAAQNLETKAVVQIRPETVSRFKDWIFISAFLRDDIGWPFNYENTRLEGLYQTDYLLYRKVHALLKMEGKTWKVIEFTTEYDLRKNKNIFQNWLTQHNLPRNLIYSW